MFEYTNKLNDLNFINKDNLICTSRGNYFVGSK